jgi:hypothetical protein
LRCITGSGSQRSAKKAPAVECIRSPLWVLCSAKDPLYEQAVALDPLRTHSHLGLGYLLYAVGRYDESHAALQKALDPLPGLPLSISLLAEFSSQTQSRSRRSQKVRRNICATTGGTPNPQEDAPADIEQSVLKERDPAATSFHAVFATSPISSSGKFKVMIPQGSDSSIAVGTRILSAGRTRYGG